MNILVFLLSWTKLGLQKLAETIFSYTFMLILKFNRMLVFFQREMELNFYLVKKICITAIAVLLQNFMIEVLNWEI